MENFLDKNNDDLADDICTWAGRMAAGMARLLELIAEFDRREGWAGPGMLSCAHWLSWRIGLAPGTAREWVRVAGRLAELPAIHAAFTSGRMSWSQVRAVTRVATVDDGVDWPEVARHTSAGQLERIVRGIRRTQRVEEVAADPERAAYQLRTRHRYDADGNLTVTIYAPAEYAPLVLAGIEAQRAELDRQRQAEAAEHVADAAPAAGTDPENTSAEPEDTAVEPADIAVEPADVPAGTSDTAAAHDSAGPPVVEPVAALPNVPAGTPSSVDGSCEPDAPVKATDGEALLAMARTVLDAQRTKHPEIARGNRSRLVVQIDPLSGWGRLRDGELLPPTSGASVMETLPGSGGTVRLRPLIKADLTAFDLGHSSRKPSLALRELLGTLDGEHCRFPGCTRRRKLQAHHVVYWSQGGGTDAQNLVLLCSRHHTLVHQLGFQLTLRPDRRLDVRTADGVAVLHHPAKPWGDPAELDSTGSVSAGTLPPTAYDSRMDLGYVVSVLLQQAA